MSPSPLSSAFFGCRPVPRLAPLAGDRTFLALRPVPSPAREKGWITVRPGAPGSGQGLAGQRLGHVPSPPAACQCPGGWCSQLQLQFQFQLRRQLRHWFLYAAHFQPFKPFNPSQSGVLNSARRFLGAIRSGWRSGHVTLIYKLLTFLLTRARLLYWLLSFLLLWYHLVAYIIVSFVT